MHKVPNSLFIHPFTFHSTDNSILFVIHKKKKTGLALKKTKKIFDSHKKFGRYRMDTNKKENINKFMGKYHCKSILSPRYTFFYTNLTFSRIFSFILNSSRYLLDRFVLESKNTKYRLYKGRYIIT